MKTINTSPTLKILAFLFLFTCSSIESYWQSKAAKIDSLLKVYQKEGKFEGALLVVDAGKVIYKNGYGLANRESNILNKANTVFRVASITKQFTAVLVIQLVEAKKINLNGKISDYLPYYRKDVGDLVSVHQLLTHTTGIPEFSCPDCSLLDTLKQKYEVSDIIKKFGSGDLDFKPGSNFRYSNMDYLILGAIIEKVTGKKGQEVLEDKILKPLGLKNTGMDAPQLGISNKAIGYFKQANNYYPEPEIYIPNLQAAASMYSTVEDLFKWNQALYATPSPLLSQEYLDIMFNEKNKPLFHLGYVGYSNWVYPVEVNSQKKVEVHERRGEVGGFHSSLVRVVDDQQSIILLSNIGISDSVGVLFEITSQIIKILHQ